MSAVEERLVSWSAAQWPQIKCLRHYSNSLRFLFTLAMLILKNSPGLQPRMCGSRS